MLSVSGCKISVPGFSEKPGPLLEEEILQAVEEIIRLSAEASSFPATEKQPAGSNPSALSLEALCERRVIPETNPCQPRAHSSYPGAHLPGSPGGARGRARIIPEIGSSIKFSCFENVRLNYLEKSGSPMRFQPRSCSFPRPPETPQGTGSPERTRDSFPQFSPPNAKDLAHLRFPTAFSVHIDKTPPLGASNSWTTPQFQSYTLNAPEVCSPTFAPGSESPTQTRKAVRRKPVPKVDLEDPVHHSFMRISRIDSFPILNPKGALKPSPSIVAKAFRRSHVVKDYSLRYFLSQGGQGKVYVATSGNPSRICAIKVISKLRVENFRTLIQEQKLLKRVKGHRFILNMIDSFHDTENFYLVSDFYPGGDLAHLLSKIGVFDTDMARFYTAELIVATQFLHDRQIVHRDLKPGNVLIKSDGHICVVDFGLCKDFNNSATPTPEWCSSDMEHVSQLTAVDHSGPTTNGFAGTLVYMSPQAVNQDAYSYDTDWWSVGIILYELLQGDTPWVGSDISSMVKKIRREPLQFRHDVPIDSSARDLIEQLLQKLVVMRLPPPLFAQHPFFQPYNFTDVENGLLTPPFIPSYHEDTLATSTLKDRDKIYVGRPYEPSVDPFPEYNYDYAEEPEDDPVSVGGLEHAAKCAGMASVDSKAAGEAPSPESHSSGSLSVQASSRLQHSKSKASSKLTGEGKVKQVVRRVSSFLRLLEDPDHTTSTRVVDAENISPQDTEALAEPSPPTVGIEARVKRPRSSILQVSSAIGKALLLSLNSGIELQPCPPVEPPTSHISAVITSAAVPPSDHPAPTASTSPKSPLEFDLVLPNPPTSPVASPPLPSPTHLPSPYLLSPPSPSCSTRGTGASSSSSSCFTHESAGTTATEQGNSSLFSDADAGNLTDGSASTTQSTLPSSFESRELEDDMHVVNGGESPRPVKDGGPGTTTSTAPIEPAAGACPVADTPTIDEDVGVSSLSPPDEAPVQGEEETVISHDVLHMPPPPRLKVIQWIQEVVRSLVSLLQQARRCFSLAQVRGRVPVKVSTTSPV